MLKFSHPPTVTSIPLLTFVLSLSSFFLQWICVCLLWKASPCPSNNPSTLHPTVLTDFLHQAQCHPHLFFSPQDDSCVNNKHYIQASWHHRFPQTAVSHCILTEVPGQQVHSLHDPTPCPLQVGVLLGNYWDTAAVSSSSDPCTVDRSGHSSVLLHILSSEFNLGFPAPVFSPLTISLPLLIPYMHECPAAAAWYASPPTLAPLVALILSYECLGPPCCISELTLPWELQPAFWPLIATSLSGRLPDISLLTRPCILHGALSPFGRENGFLGWM